MAKVMVFAVMALIWVVMPARAAAGAAAQDNDQTLRAMRDEMARSKTRLELKIPGTNEPVKPYYVEYRLLDLDVREIVGQFGTLLTSTHTRNRFMDVEARVGSYKLDSSNFIGDEGFRGFIGSQGSVGIDRDYDSLRQDLWIATDQAFKEAIETYSRKQAYLSSLARQSDVDDFSKTTPIQNVEPLVMADWSNRNWEQEARDTSATLRHFSGNLRIARDVLSGFCHRIPDDQRRNGNSYEPFVRGDRIGYGYASEGRHAAESIVFNVRAETSGSAERGHGTQGIERFGQRVDGLARGSAGAGLHRTGVV